MKIPENEQENALHIIWTLVSEAESKLKDTDVILRHQISGTYDFLNRIKFTKHRPRFENKPNTRREPTRETGEKL